MKFMSLHQVRYCNSHGYTPSLNPKIFNQNKAIINSRLNLNAKLKLKKTCVL
jgi:hypothetical protein